MEWGFENEIRGIPTPFARPHGFVGFPFTPGVTPWFPPDIGTASIAPGPGPAGRPH